MTTGKAIVLKAAGFGAGVVLAVSLDLGTFAWWSKRPVEPRPMSNRAITASFSEITIQTRGEVFYFNAVYGLHNNTDLDYSLPSNGSFMIVDAHNKGLDTVDGVKWNSDVVIPPGQTVNMKFEIPYKLSDYDLTGAKVISDKSEIDFAAKRMKEMDGFRFFDSAKRYEIDFPKWPTIAKPQ